ncbi:MAG TPA: tryptophan-rich sensory protein [Ignavibacteria bacterium]|nr:tryptophan-rich sensory protein [Ignavibacteria bacterium]HMQ99566.1 tryptophan-rich sensory protein [Ignavibacteria bacterium]
MKILLKLIFSIIICQLAGVIGSFFTVSNITSWYIDLNKPLLNPPNWVFGPVWITLYFLMGIALFLVWNKGLQSRFNRNAIILFMVQLLLNSLWSIVFFGLHQLLFSIFVIVLLWLLIFINIVQFGRISKTAAYLLIPYILWVSFASYLNIAIYILN